MLALSKKNILKKVRERQFEKKSTPLFELLEKHIERVEFVKDYLGLRDVLFVSELGSEGFRFPVFACFDVNVIVGNRDHNLIEMENSLLHDYDSIYKKTSELLNDTNRILYVGIGFKETSPTSEMMFEIYESMKNKEVDNPIDALVKLRKFPTWYKAKFPHEIEREKRFFDFLKRTENYLLNDLKTQLINEINESLLHNNEKRFTELSNYYNMIK